MEYTEAVDREIEALEVFEKKSGLTEVGKIKIEKLRKCRDDFKNLHLPLVGKAERDLLIDFMTFYDGDENSELHEDVIKIIDTYLEN